MDTMNKNILLFGTVIIIMLTLVIKTANADIYVGVADGYVTNLTGHAVNGATVNAEVQSCTTGCTGSTTPDINGYYVINNLNAAASQTIEVDATLGNYYGNNSGQTDAYYTAQINITVAQVPSTPTLTPINDTHNNSIIIFIWTNYTDPQGLATYNEWTFDRTTYTPISSPQNKTDVDFDPLTDPSMSAENFNKM